MQEVSIRRSRDTGGEEGSHFSNETETSPQDPVLCPPLLMWLGPPRGGHLQGQRVTQHLPIQTLAARPIITIGDGRFVI